MGRTASVLDRPLVLYLLLVPVLFLLFRVGLDFNGFYGQDAHEYLRYTRALHVYFSGGHAPYAFHWPVLYPLLGALLSFILPAEMSLQLVSMFSLAGALYFVYRILLFYSDEKRKVIFYTLLFGLFSSYFLRLGVCAMSDTLAIFFITLTLFFLVKCYYAQGLLYFVYAFVFACAAFFTRYASLVVLALPFAFLSVVLVARKGLRVLLLVTAFLLALVLYGSAFELYHPEEVHSYLDGWRVANYFKNSFSSEASGMQSYRLPNVLFVLSVFVNPGFIPGGIVFLFLSAKKSLKPGILFLFLLPVLVYCFFLAGFPLQNMRLLTLAFPFLLLLCFPGFLRLLELLSLRRIYWKSIAVVVVLVQLVLFYFAFDDFVAGNRLDRKISLYINEHYKDEPVWTFGMEGSLNTYLVGHTVFSLFRGEIPPAPALILVSTGQMESQWKEQPAGLAWEALRSAGHLKKIMSFERGWDLYEEN